MDHKPGVDVGDRRFTDLVYTDDTTFLESSTSDAAECFSSFNRSSSTLGLSCRLGENQHPGHLLRPTVTWYYNTVEHVENFVYLQGSTQSSDRGSEPDIKRRIVVASSVTASLQWTGSDRDISLPTTARVYSTVVLYLSLHTPARHGHCQLLTQGVWGHFIWNASSK